MASILREKILGYYGSLVAQLHRQSRATIIFATVSLVSLGIVPAAYRDYKLFMSYGPGGVPYNLFGWLLVTVFLRPLGSEMLSTALYEQSDDERTWLPADGIVVRAGNRPTIGPHTVPQRQLSQIPAHEFQQKLVAAFTRKLVAAFDDLARQNQHLLKMSPSILEKHTNALFLADTVKTSPITEQLKGEISHIHGTSDHSVHVTLSPVDCQKVIKAGWGQRHPLDGSKSVRVLTGLMLPKQYLLIYAPRNDQELETVMQIVKASVGYMTGTSELKPGLENRSI